MIQSVIHDFWILFQIILGYNLVFPIIILLIYLPVKALSKYKAKEPSAETDYAIIVTAYEHTQTLPAVIKSLLQLKYQNYLIYIVADKCDISELRFEDKRVILLRPETTLGSNTRSHFYAIDRFKRNHERLTIIDSDNLVDPDYLNELNKLFNAGFIAVQGERKAKNINTTYACLDAARDIYYHFYDGVVLFGAGSSGTLAGSGMAFTVQLYKDCLESLDITGAGFDKVLQKEILLRKFRIAFSKKAIVYDEKTTRSDQLVKQRARWINTWFRYFKFGFILLFKGVRNLNWNQFLFGTVLLRPPLFIFLLISLCCFTVNLFLNTFAAIIWALGFGLFIIGFLLSLIFSKTDKRIYLSLINIPKFVFFQVLSLLKVTKANQVSVATQHYFDKTIEEIKK